MEKQRSKKGQNKPKEEEKVGIKTYKSIVIRVVCIHVEIDKNTNGTTEITETDPCTQGNLIYDNSDLSDQWGKQGHSVRQKNMYFSILLKISKTVRQKICISRIEKYGI